MKQLSLVKKNSINSLKLTKLNYLLENSKESNTKIFLTKKMEKSDLSENLQKALKNSRDFPLYFSILEKPVNLLFSKDQFLFEFSKKIYQQKKTGEFSQQLKERKKFTLFYGNLTKKQVVNLFNKVKNLKGYFHKNVFSLLERRLDVVIYRTGFTKTIAEARQIIKHKKILVNQKLVNVPSYFLNPGDLISVSPETMIHIKSQLLNGVNTKSQNNQEKFHQNFYTNFLKRLKRSSVFDLFFEKKQMRQKVEQSTSNSKDLKNLKNYKDFQSLLLCKIFIQLLCTRIKLRCFWNLRKNIFGKSFATSSNLENFNTNFLEKTVLIRFKRKPCSKNVKEWRKNVSEKNLYRSKNKEQKSFSTNKRASDLSKTKENLLFDFLQKSLKRKPVSFKRSLIKSQKRTRSERLEWKKKNNLRFLKNKTRNLAVYRRSFFTFFKHLENSQKFTRLLTLMMKKYFRKISNFDTRYYGKSLAKTMNFRGIKPIHLEVSYNLLNIIYLYSPQRVNFPFSLDLDLIKRSLR